MLKKVDLKKKFSYIAVAVMALVLMFAPASAQAASNPLAKMPTKASDIANKAILGIGDNFCTPEYNSKVKISVKSSNTKVATVKGNAYSYKDWQTGKRKYYAGYKITPVSGGTAKIYVKVKVSGKTYSKTCVFKSYKWQNPFTTFKIGSTNYTSKLNKTGVVRTQKTINGKVYYKVRSGFSVKVTVGYYSNPKNLASWKTKTIKSGQTLPKNTENITIKAKSKKNGQIYTVGIYK